MIIVRIFVGEPWLEALSRRCDKSAHMAYGFFPEIWFTRKENIKIGKSFNRPTDERNWASYPPPEKIELPTHPPPPHPKEKKKSSKYSLFAIDLLTL